MRILDQCLEFLGGLPNACQLKWFAPQQTLKLSSEVNVSHRLLACLDAQHLLCRLFRQALGLPNDIGIEPLCCVKDATQSTAEQSNGLLGGDHDLTNGLIGDHGLYSCAPSERLHAVATEYLLEWLSNSGVGSEQ
jgi:hypothetical protein